MVGTKPSLDAENLVLKALLPGPVHFHGLLNRMRETSQDVLHGDSGVLFLTVHRLERRGLLASELRTGEDGCHTTYYALTGDGRGRLVCPGNTQST
jgi:DNA-binding PadR family transcriptional regulator